MLDPLLIVSGFWFLLIVVSLLVRMNRPRSQHRLDRLPGSPPGIVQKISSTPGSPNPSGKGFFQTKVIRPKSAVEFAGKWRSKWTGKP